MAKLNKGTIETVKTVVIAVLITAIVAFIGGMKYAQNQEARLNSVRQATVAPATEAKK